MGIKKTEWENSYERKENFIFYPYEEGVKFLNRFIRKKTGFENEFINILNSDNELKGLDFGCGIGRMTMLLKEFNIEGYGIDISENAIKEAKNLSKMFGYDMDNNFWVYDGQIIPFENNFFDFTISHGVLDSLPFELAKKLLKEIDRVTKKYFYLSLISAESRFLFSSLIDNNNEIIVQENHEKGTVQSFYDMNKINSLIEGTNFIIKQGELTIFQDIFIPEKKHGRYNIVLEKK